MLLGQGQIQREFRALWFLKGLGCRVECNLLGLGFRFDMGSGFRIQVSGFRGHFGGLGFQGQGDSMLAVLKNPKAQTSKP